MIDKTLIKLFEHELLHAARDVKREVNAQLDSCEWVVFYPEYDHVNPSEMRTRISIGLSNQTPYFVPKEEPFDMDAVSWDDKSYWVKWPLAPHLDGTVWVKSDRIKKAEVTPFTFDMLDNLPVLMQAPNTLMYESIRGVLGIDGEDYDTDVLIDEFLKDLSTDTLRLDVVFDDVDRTGFVPLGKQTAVIRFGGEVIGYMGISGRELMNVTVYAKDKHNFLSKVEELVDMGNLRDKMVVPGVIEIDGRDADIFLGVPGLTNKNFEWLTT